MTISSFKEQINERITRDSIFSIGKIHTIEGRKVTIKVYKDKNLSHFTYNGEIVKNVSVGSHIKVMKGFVEMIGKVEGERVVEDTQHSDSSKESPRYAPVTAGIERFLDISLIGYFEGKKFHQGIKEMPLLDNECYLFNRDDYRKLYDVDVSKESGLYVGQLAEDSTQAIYLNINRLIASHIGIFGNTGSGKSNTLTRIYTQLFTEHLPLGSRFILFDFSGEYLIDDIFMKRADKKEIYNSDNKYTISISKGEQLELVSMLLEATEKTQKPFLYRAINSSDSGTKKQALIDVIKALLDRRDSDLGVYVFYELFDRIKFLTKDKSQVEEFLKETKKKELQFINDFGTKYYKTKTINKESRKRHPKDNPPTSKEIYDEIFDKFISYQLFLKDNMLNDLQFKILIQFYQEICENGHKFRHNIEPMISRMPKNFTLVSELIDFRPGKSPSSPLELPGRILEIIDFHNADFDAKKIATLIIARKLYSIEKQNKRDNSLSTSLHIIIDEAHNILSDNSKRESDDWKDYRVEFFEEIIKEGRKFGVFVTLSSQRPYDISHTILSQLHNYFIHRMINEDDIRSLRQTVAYLDKLSFESIPVLPVGRCFIAGTAYNLPVAVDVSPAEVQPSSETISLVKMWNASKAKEDEQGKEEISGAEDEDWGKEEGEEDEDWGEEADNDLPF